MTDLLGTWTLISCVSQRGDIEVSTFGDPPAGQLQYTRDGRMSAFLMDPAWAAAGDPTANSFTQFFSYGGIWRREGDMVTHEILFASQPSRVGTSFTGGSWHWTTTRSNSSLSRRCRSPAGPM